MPNGDIANNTINICNGSDCTTYAEKHGKMYPGQPLVWTENEGWYQEWDKQPLTSHDNRTAEDMANVVMKWIACRGSYHNYYLWYGGNNFGRWAGPCVANESVTGVNIFAVRWASNEPNFRGFITCWPNMQIICLILPHKSVTNSSGV